jgi:hypothetical protein
MKKTTGSEEDSDDTEPARAFRDWGEVYGARKGPICGIRATANR